MTNFWGAWGRISAGLLAVGLCLSAAAQPKLLPAPREAHWGNEASLSERIAVVVPGKEAEDKFAAENLREFLGKSAAKDEPVRAAWSKLPSREEIDARLALAGGYQVVLLRAETARAKAFLSKEKLSFDDAMKDEGYILVVGPKRTTIIGASAAGVFYGVQTFKQLLPLAGQKRTIATGTVRDWPAMRYRGVQDDLSRGPVPTLAFQKHQIELLASYKANVYSPYMEHVLQYTKYPVPAPVGGALTPADVKELVAFAAQYHVTIIPEQEAFGHLHHVLKYEIYKDTAETPHGHVISPVAPGTLPLMKDWFTQIAAEFPSPFIHIGADETWDLGIGRTSEQVAQRGYGPVYVDFIKQVHETLKPLNKKLLFWGDLSWDEPSAIAGLPKDMIAVPWNYGKTKDFTKMLEPFQKAGMETWVAPGVSNWNQVYPQAGRALPNIQGFVREGQLYGATGVLNTVWYDDGEGLFNQNWYGVIFGPVAGWQKGESSIADYQNAYGETFHGDASGKINEAQKELTAATQILADAKINLTSDGLFWLDPWTEQGQKVSEKILPLASELRLHAEKALVLLFEAQNANSALRNQNAILAMDLGARRLDLIGMKFQLADEISKGYAQVYLRQQEKKLPRPIRAGLTQSSGANGRCQDLRDAYSATKDEFSRVWLDENRPYWLNNVTVRYDLEIQKWQQRGTAFWEAIGNWNSGKGLPAPETLGMPKLAQ